MNVARLRCGLPLLVLAVVLASLAACLDARGQNAAALPAPLVDAPLASSSAPDTAVLAGGCFWGLEGVFEHVRGVESVVSGYSGGSVTSPSYERVSSGSTGHAESVRIIYDPSRISYGQLLRVFFSVAHDPTQLDRQGPDVGPQYRSAIFFADANQKRIAEGYLAQLGAAGVFSRPIVTQLAPLGGFYAAEPYHQDYMARHPKALYIVMNDAPKVEKLRAELPAMYRN